jgi:hypothetical protein
VTTLRTAAALGLLLWASSPLAAGQLDLTGVKSLYASASYEEALALLNNAGAGPDEAVEQYRALCFLALGRNRDAQLSLEKIVLLNPLYRLDESDVSPRLVEMFHDVRRQTLPTAARELYGKAKTNFDAERYSLAVVQFNELLAVIGDADAAAAKAALAELDQLARGFLKLSEAALARSMTPAPAASAGTGAGANAPTIYTAFERGVVQPTEVNVRMPTWSPPEAIVRTMPLRGVLEIVIDERGAIESAVVTTSVSPLYDPRLVAAAKDWRFNPATRNGVAVKFYKVISVTLNPPTGASGPVTPVTRSR